jgi:nicotinamidase/pyrazinamidase
MQDLIIAGPADSDAYSEMERLADQLQAKHPTTVRVIKLRKHPSSWPAERAKLVQTLGLGASLVSDARAPFCYLSTGRLIGDLAVFRDLARGTYGVVLDLDAAALKAATANNLVESEREKRQFAMHRALREGGKRALLIIDVQNDFCSGGSLAVPNSEQVVILANRLRATCSWDLIVLTQDWHPANHGSFAVNNGVEPNTVLTLPDMGEQVMWPVHCVQGSAGAEFHPLLHRRSSPPGVGPEPEEVVVFKGTHPRVDSYSGFGDAQGGKVENTGLDALLRSRGITDVFVCGLALDFCVAYTCKDAVRKGFQAFCLAGAAAGITAAGIAKERELMKAAGVVLVDNADDVPTRDIDAAVAAGVTGGVLAAPDAAALAAVFAAAAPARVAGAPSSTVPASAAPTPAVAAATVR